MMLDVRGEICPYPVLRTLEALNQLKSDEELHVIIDHAPALVTIPWQAAKRGYLVDVQEVGGGEWQLTLRRTDQPLDPLKVVQDVAQRVSDGAYRTGLVGVS
jgi:tRNA 2-thiouridine synthesizing protein A